jgi:hypothetical protein
MACARGDGAAKSGATTGSLETAMKRECGAASCEAQSAAAPATVSGEREGHNVTGIRPEISGSREGGLHMAL